MRIKSINLSMGAHLGLRACQLSPLGGLVVLAGPNGAGKSRVLRYVKEILSTEDFGENSLAISRQVVVNFARESTRRPRTAAEVTQHEKLRERIRRRDSFVVDETYTLGRVLEFFPKEVELADNRMQSESQSLTAYRRLTNLGINSIEKHVLAYVASVYRRSFNATHPDVSVSAADREEAVRSRNDLADLVTALIGEAPKIDLDQQPRLYGQPIHDANLSDGQKLLLQVAVALHAQGAKLDGLVLILDEPECHLHPTAVIAAIERLRKCNPNGQIWMATHCVPILASVPPDCIWFVADGEASWAGRRPELVIEGLLGGPEGRERMEEFLRLPAQFASNRFAAECLVPPSVVDTGADDPQARQLREFCEAIQGNRPQGEPLKILDYGAGLGRLLSAMRDRWAGPEVFHKAIDYRAFEPGADDANQLRAVIDETYNDGCRDRLFRGAGELSLLNARSVDIIVMCNVFHEIPPQEWVRILGDGGVLQRLLSVDGYLLILEDMEIPHGEMAHRFGFLLLDVVQLRLLLRCREEDGANIRTVEERGGRLKAHAVSARLLGRTTGESVRASLKNLRDSSKERIRALRSGPSSSRNGRLHGLWTQLFVNAELAIEELS